MLVIGHRGWRGNFPENTILGVEKAVELGVDGIEIDVVVNKDKQLVVSHEAWMNPDICAPGGKELNIFEMSQLEIEKIDCGLKHYNAFPYQQKTACTKPLLKTLLNTFDWQTTKLFFEIKSLPAGDNTFHPAPEEYIDLIIREFNSFKDIKNVFFMSFDTRILENLKRRKKEWKIVQLFEKTPDSLSFKPDAFAPHHKHITPENVQHWKSNDIEVYPWTVNDLKSIVNCQECEVTGIISDYPNRLFG